MVSINWDNVTSQTSDHKISQKRIKMITQKITKKDFKRLIKNKKFTRSIIHKCQAEINGKIIYFEKNCYHSILKDLFRHFTPEQITNVFPRSITNHSQSYQKDDDLGIWLYAKPINETIKDIYKFIKYKKIRFNISFILEGDNNCIYNYSRKFNIPPDDDVFYDCEFTNNIPVDINNEGFEETKGEEATQEAEMNAQRGKKNRWHIKRCNDNGIIIKQRYFKAARDLVNDENWPEIKTKDNFNDMHNRPHKKQFKLNITISALFK